MPLPVTDAPQGSQVWSRCYQKCLRLSDANSLITPALITRSRRGKTKLPHWKSCGLGQTSCGEKPRSFVTGPFLLSARFAATWRGAPSQPRTCRGHWSNLYGSVHVLLQWTLSTRVYARAASRVWSAYRPLRFFVTSSTRSRPATSLALKVFALNFKPAKIGTNMPSRPGLYLRSSRLLNQRTFCNALPGYVAPLKWRTRES